MPVKKTFYVLPKRLKMLFLKPVSSEDIETKNLNKKVYDIMYDEFTKNQ